MYKTTWTNQGPELTEAQQKTLDWEVSCVSEDIDCASDLIFHIVKLTDDWDGPIVMIDGREGVADTLFLTYYKTAEWGPL